MHLTTEHPTNYMRQKSDWPHISPRHSPSCLQPCSTLSQGILLKIHPHFALLPKTIEPQPIRLRWMRGLHGQGPASAYQSTFPSSYSPYPLLSLSAWNAPTPICLPQLLSLSLQDSALAPPGRLLHRPAIPVLSCAARRGGVRGLGQPDPKARLSLSLTSAQHSGGEPEGAHCPPVGQMWALVRHRELGSATWNKLRLCSLPMRYTRVPANTRAVHARCYSETGESRCTCRYR